MALGPTKGHPSQNLGRVSGHPPFSTPGLGHSHTGVSALAPHCPSTLSRRLGAPDLLFKTPPWPLASEPRLEGPQEVGGEQDPQSGGGAKQKVSEPRAGWYPPHSNSNKNNGG